MSMEEFEDTNRVSRIHKSVKDRQHNGQKKKDKRTKKKFNGVQIYIYIQNNKLK